MKEIYPELEKVKAAQPYSQTIGEFMEFCNKQGYHLACYDNETEYLSGERPLIPAIPLKTDIHKLISLFFDIDLDKAEAERAEILNSLTTTPKQ